MAHSRASNSNLSSDGEPCTAPGLGASEASQRSRTLGTNEPRHDRSSAIDKRRSIVGTDVYSRKAQVSEKKEQRLGTVDSGGDRGSSAIRKRMSTGYATSLFNFKPVQRLQNRRYMTILRTTVNSTRKRILNELQTINFATRKIQ
jgi:hypothetical protein